MKNKKDNFTEPVHLLKEFYIKGFERGWTFRKVCRLLSISNHNLSDDYDLEFRDELKDIEKSFDSKEAFLKFVLGL